MSNTFENKLGCKVFASNLFRMNNEIPSDRFIDNEYNELKKRSLINEEKEAIPIDDLIKYWSEMAQNKGF